MKSINYDSLYNYLHRKSRYSFFSLFILLSLSFLMSFIGFAQPIGLTVNFLLYPDRVFLNGYPVDTELSQAVRYNENFQFTEIAHKQPLFGWIVPSERNYTLQKAYHIIVASSLENIQNNIGDMWDSGKIESEQSINIRYSGNFLEPNTVYFWKVKIWDNYSIKSPFSAIRQFKTASALLDYYGYEYSGTTKYPLQKEDSTPQLIKPLTDTNTFVDFGKARFGRLRITLFGTAEDDTVTIHLGEAIKDNIIDRNPGGSIRYEFFKIRLQPDWNTYEIIIPTHNYARQDRIIRMPKYIGEVMPFRYCEIENYPGSLLNKTLIQQVSVHYPFNDEASFFHSSDTVLNEIWNLCKHTIKATSCFGIYVDGDRERFPREADSYINQLSHYGVERGLSIARYTHEFQIKYSSQWTEWILHVVLAAWADYMETGEKSSLEQFYKDLKAKTLMSLAREDGLISTKSGLVTPEVIKSVHWHENEWRRQKTDQPAFRDIVDWPQSGGFGGVKGETDNFEFTPINTVVNAFHFRTLELMEKIALVSNKSEDARFFKERAALVKKTFNNKLLDSNTGIYLDGEESTHSSLHANMFPLAFGIVPEKNISKVVEFIRSRGMACSPYGGNYLLESLYKAGEAEYALQLLSSTDERHWGYWIYELGSTMALEAWDKKYKSNLDWNHPWGTAPANIIPRKLMGIEPLEPGYRKVRIKPQPASLKQAEIQLPTIRGNIQVAFNNQLDESFELHVNIPPNMTAEVYLPFWDSNQKVTQNGQVVAYQIMDNFAVIDNVGSGENTFNLK